MILQLISKSKGATTSEVIIHTPEFDLQFKRTKCMTMNKHKPHDLFCCGNVTCPCPAEVQSGVRNHRLFLWHAAGVIYSQQVGQSRKMSEVKQHKERKYECENDV